jgi:hypothetical protein
MSNDHFNGRKNVIKKSKFKNNTFFGKVSILASDASDIIFYIYFY